MGAMFDCVLCGKETEFYTTAGFPASLTTRAGNKICQKCAETKPREVHMAWAQVVGLIGIVNDMDLAMADETIDHKAQLKNCAERIRRLLGGV